MSSLRKTLSGFSLSGDRLWRVWKGEQSFAMTDYNCEITGASPELASLVNYGDPLHFAIKKLRDAGFDGEFVEDRK